MDAVRRRWLAAIATMLLALVTVPPAHTQTYPAKPIRLVIAYPPGGAADPIARIVATKLSEVLGQQVVVENRGGASGNIASQLVARAAPDGYTLLLHASVLVVNAALFANPGYDPIADFTPICQVADYMLVVTVHPSLGVNTLKELIDAAKARPGTIAFASAGGGSTTHLAVELLKQAAGIDLMHVPYTGGGPATNDLYAGHVKLMVNNPLNSLPGIRSGQIKALAVTGPHRLAQLPDIPTVVEFGYPGFEASTWYGIFGPAKLAPAIVATLSDGIRKVMAMPDTKENLNTQGLNVIGSTPEETAAVMKSDLARWQRVVKAANLKVE
jgi:tripartite-type tricarboxylate transporter receptor subunit TctC